MYKSEGNGLAALSCNSLNFSHISIGVLVYITVRVVCTLLQRQYNSYLYPIYYY